MIIFHICKVSVRGKVWKALVKEIDLTIEINTQNNLSFLWIAGHGNVLGNKEAEKAKKKNCKNQYKEIKNTYISEGIKL